MDDYITGELIEATYLFCRKRLSNNEAAKDLSQDIIFAALRAIRSGAVFHSFYSWYWQMARNKYADYIRSVKNPALPLETVAGQAIDLSLDDGLISKEETAQLNFSLSRLSSMHREIIVRFYLKEQSVSEIAKALDIPVGTVKGRLFDARKKLKERITDMSITNTGKSAYAPAEVDYFFGYNCHNAHIIMAEKIPRQTAVICRGEGKSLVEISDELGVAPVYLEDFVRKMTDEGLLKKQGDKYLTNFCVFPKEIYAKAKHKAHLTLIENNIPEKISKALEGIKEKITALDFYGNDFDYGYLMWIFYSWAAYFAGVDATEKYIKKYGDRYPNETEREYRITLQYILPDENPDLSEYVNVKQMHWSNLGNQYKTAEFGLVDYVNGFECEPFECGVREEFMYGRDCWVDENNISLLIALSREPSKALNKFEEEKAADFIQNGVITKTSRGLRVNLPIMSLEVIGKIRALIDEAVKPIAEEYAETISKSVEEIVLPYVRKDLMSNFIHWDMQMFFKPVGELYYYGLNDSEYLQKPEDYSRSAAALWIVTH